jgi:CubicO group peptidase (beta-lactamase class C family)
VQAFLDEKAAAYGVPGAAFATLADKRIDTYATGTLELGSGRPATTESLFRLGSVTKLYTVTLVMQLVQSGELALDAPVRGFVPGLDERITVWHLLTHSSGIVGDHFEDTGSGDDCIARYVAGLGALEPLHAPGELFSYCNAGMIVAGRIVEIVTGLPFERALTEQLLEPNGLHDTVALPEELVVRARRGEIVNADVERLAVGHAMGPEGMKPVAADRVVDAIWTRAIAPAGSTLAATAADLVRFAQVHLAGGFDAMQQAQLPNLGPANAAVGLAWMLDDVDGHRVLSHGGQHEGAGAGLWVLPDDDFAFAFVGNGPTALMLLQDVAEKLRGETGLPLPRRRTAEPASEPIDLEAYAGSYYPGVAIEVRNGSLVVRYAGMEMPLVPADETTFLVAGAPAVTFVEVDGARFVHMMNRAFRRR